MCRPTAEGLPGVAGFSRKHDRLKIRAFYLRISVARGRIPLSDALTLVYLPRIDGNLLEINGHRVPPEASAIVPLHRIVHPAEPPPGVRCAEEAVFASTDRVRAGGGVRFDAYVGEERLLRGAFRRGDGWEMDLWSAAEGEEAGAAAEVWVMGERGVAMRQRVEVAAKEEDERRRRRRRGFGLKLEEIPEERDGCDCLCCEGGDDEDEEDEEEDRWEIVGWEGGDLKLNGGKEMDGEDVELEMEGVKWAVDVGIWVMCLGVGLLVSRAPYKNLLRKLI